MAAKGKTRRHLVYNMRVMDTVDGGMRAKREMDAGMNAL